MSLDQYLKENRAELLALVASIAASFAIDEDSKESRRSLTQSTYKALRMALEELFVRAEPGEYYGFHQGLGVCVVRPPLGKDLYGHYPVSAAMFSSGGMVPSPADWPSSKGALPPFLESLLTASCRPQVASHIVTATKGGFVKIGPAVAKRRMVVDELPDGDFWLHLVEAG